MSHTAQQIADLVQGELIGEADRLITGVSQIEDASASDLCFISNKKYIHHLETTNAGAVIVEDSLEVIPKGKTVIKCKMPYVAFCQVLIQLFDYKDPNTGIHPTAVIAEDALIGDNVYLGPHVVVSNGVVIGDNSKVFANTTIYENSTIGSNTIIYANVSVYHHSVIGNDCIIHSGTVIGSDGFGHAPLPDKTYIKIPQIGNVVIGNNVEIGSNCSIDRANMGSTSIGDGCRIDNLIQIAHGVQVGEHTVIAAQAGISGSTKVGDHCVIAGQVGIVGHISIANGVQIGAQSGVSNTIKEEGGKFADSPHLPLSNAIRSRILYKKLPEIDKRLSEIEKNLNHSDNNG
ncbi:MAG: UDP-3-O-(3-hydroxymyristoyl)glucosamine N-acyltransferase [Bacteroidia bacterium]